MALLAAVPACIWCQTGRQDSRHGSGERRAASGSVLTAADEELFRRASEDVDGGRVERARPVLSSLAAKYPSAGMVQEAYGMLLAEGGDSSGALPHLERAGRLIPESGPVGANLGVAYLKAGRSAEAAETLKHAAAIDPKNAQTQFALGQALMAIKDYGGAAKSFEFVAGVVPEQAGVAPTDVLYDWALALTSDKRPQEAAAVLGRSPDVESSAASQQLLGEIEEQRGRFEEALKHFEQAAQLTPSEGNVYALGVELLRHWSFSAAAKIFVFGVQRYPESRQMALGLGLAYYGESDYKAAIPVLLALLKKNPKDERAVDLMGRSCSAVGVGEGAGCDELIEFAMRHPGNATAATYAATTILHQPGPQQDLSRAEGLLRSAIAANPREVEAYYELGALEQARNRWPESVTLLERAVALRPEYAEAHYRLSRAYAHLGEREKAQVQVALQQQYSQQEKDALNQRLHEVVTFLTSAN